MPESQNIEYKQNWRDEYFLSKVFKGLLIEEPLPKFKKQQDALTAFRENYGEVTEKLPRERRKNNDLDVCEPGHYHTRDG